MYYKRDLSKILARIAKFPVVGLLGPRQSGKTTLVKKHFKKHRFFSFEDPAVRELAASDPRAFLRENENKYGIILDEFQYVPEILSYIQLEVDEKQRPGYFVLSGSQNFLMNKAITQSLAGRIGLLTLLPFSLHELKVNKLLEPTANNMIIKGFYPRIYAQNINPQDFYAAYLHTYIERDVRQLVNVGDLRTFQTFIKLCAGRIGQTLNIAEIGGNCGISAQTVHRWLSILEASYILFFLPPHLNNFKKRLTKSPKLYFYDTGLAAYLLEITTSSLLALNPFKGPLFENLIIADCAKQFYHTGRRPALSFWRDHNGRVEVDCIISKAGHPFPVEIKSGETIQSSFFDGLERWNEISETLPAHNYVVYAGEMQQKRTKGSIINWQSAGELVTKIWRLKIGILLDQK